MKKSKLKDRAAGCLAGVAIGDAMGMPTQFMAPEEIESEFGWIDGFVAAPSWHPYSEHPAGSVTDDTQQTLALADKLLETGDHLTPESTAEALLDWAKGRGLLDTDFIGPSTGRALKRIDAGGSPERSGFKGHTNGASMRIGSIGIVNPLLNPEAEKELIKDVRAVCKPTHNTPIAISGATAVAGAIAQGISGSSDVDIIVETGERLGKKSYREAKDQLPSPAEVDEEMILEVLSGRTSPCLKERIEFAIEAVRGEDRKKLPRRLYDLVGTGVNTIETVPAAFALLAATGGEPDEAVRLAANAGGDTDTLGAITGGMAGARTGLSGFPEEYLEKVETVNDLNIELYAEKLVELRLKRGEG